MANDPDNPLLTLPPAESSASRSWTPGRHLYNECRRQLLSFLTDATDVVAVVGSLRTGEAKQVFQAVFPPEALRALEKGDLHLREAKEGPGFLPFLYDQHGIRKQVRLVPERVEALDQSAFTNAAANAATHALLRQVLAKLDAIESKVNEVLANQQAMWRGSIAAGVQQLKVIEAEPGEAYSRGAILANAMQSIEEGRHTGLLQLKGFLEREGPPPRSWFQQVLEGIRFRVPSKKQAAVLDRVQEDLEWLYVASISVAKIHQSAGRESLAFETLPIFASAVAPLIEDCRERLNWARFSRSRTEFWEVRARDLQAFPESRRLPVAVEFELKEIEGAHQ